MSAALLDKWFGEGKGVYKGEEPTPTGLTWPFLRSPSLTFSQATAIRLTYVHSALAELPHQTPLEGKDCRKDVLICESDDVE